jgi:nucleotide-binding universal stress UspA family protein
MMQRATFLKLAQEQSSQHFSKLLVAIDGSEIADYALNLAVHVGEKYESSQVDLIYVTAAAIPVTTPTVFDPVFAGQGISPVPSVVTAEQTQEDMRKAMSRENALVEERRKHVAEAGLACETMVIDSDDVAGEIIRAGEKGKYDLIVVGSRGLSGIKSWILGSVSKRVAKEAKGSVLIVKNKIDSLPKILLAYDGSPESKKALAVAIELGKKFNGQVNPIAVVNIPLSPEGHVMTDIDKWEKEMKDYVVEAVTALKAQNVPGEGKVLNSVDVPRAICEEAARDNYDLIVVGHRGIGRLKSLFLGSVASGIADNSKTNVLIAR